MTLTLCRYLLFIAAIVAANKGAVSERRDYSVIFERNPFGLRPPPPPKTSPGPVKVASDEVFLTGITAIREERAYFMSKPRPGQAPEYYSLTVGEARNSLEVLGIDPEAKTVRVRRDGLEMVMSFQANGVKPPPVSKPLSPGHTPGRVQLPGTLRSAPLGAPARTIPARTVRTTSKPNLSAVSNQAAPRRFAAEQDIVIMELQKIANPHIQYPPTPMPP